MVVICGFNGSQLSASAFSVQEAIIDQIQQAIPSQQITTVGVVEQCLACIKAYNDICVNQPQGIFGPITAIPHAGAAQCLSRLTCGLPRG